MGPLLGNHLNPGGFSAEFWRDLSAPERLQNPANRAAFTVLPDFSCPEVTIIHCGAERVTRGVFRRKSGRLAVAGYRAEGFTTGGGDASDWLENTCAAIRALRPESGACGPAIVVLPPQVTLLKHLRTPRVDDRKRARIIGFEAGQNIPHPLDEVVWDSVLSGASDTTQNVLLAAAKREIVEALCGAAQAAGFRLRLVVPSVLAILAACRMVRPTPEESELLLNFSPRSATLLHLSDRSFAARTLVLGGEMIEAETFAARLASEVARSVLHFQRQCGLADPVRLRVTGDGPPLEKIGSALEQRLKIPVQWIGLTDVAGDESGSNASAAGPAGVRAEMAGAAALQLLPPHPVLNLLPTRLRTQQRRERRVPGLAVAAVLALTVPVGPLVQYHRLAEAAETKAAELEVGLTPLRLHEARNRENLGRLAELERQIEAWQAVEARRGGWLRLFADLQERLARVEDVWMESLQVLPETADGPLRLAVSGRMLDRAGPGMEATPESFRRMKALIAALEESTFVGSVEHERFDRSEPGFLGFDFVLVTEAQEPL